MKELNNLDMERTLMFQVMNWSRFGSHELIGQTTVFFLFFSFFSFFRNMN